MYAVTYPNISFGTAEKPKQETILFKNTTVWTGEKDGILKETDVLIQNGKIAKIGKNLPSTGAKVVDGTGKHLTAGIIDEHSHIAISNGVNEGGQNSSAEVTIEDVVNSDDINIYRNLAGGVTSANLLHGSANPIGGRAAFIKLKWGYATQQQAAAKGIDAGSWQKSKNALAKVEKLFADKLQGSKSALQNAILKGKAGNLNGIIEDQMLGELGDPATATVVAAAAPIIIATINILKEAGLIGKNENIDINKLSSEIANDPSATAAMMEIESSENLPATNDPIPMSQTTSESTSSTASGSSGGGIMNFIKKNPVPAVIGGGLLAFGIYIFTVL